MFITKKKKLLQRLFLLSGSPDTSSSVTSWDSCKVGNRNWKFGRCISWLVEPVTSLRPKTPVDRRCPLRVAMDATGRWGDGGWPTCQTNASDPGRLLCYPQRSSRWRRSFRSCRSQTQWRPPGFSTGSTRKNKLTCDIKCLTCKKKLWEVCCGRITDGLPWNEFFL